MRSVLLGSVIGIAVATVLFGMSETTQSASAICAGPIGKERTSACTFPATGERQAIANDNPGGNVAQVGNPFSCAGKPSAFGGNTVLCAP